MAFHPHTNFTSAPSSAGRIWCRGDSLTVGFNAFLGGFFYPLFNALTSANITSTFVGSVLDAVRNMWHSGISGDYCFNAKGSMAALAAALTPDIVIFWLGTNDPVVHGSDLATTKSDWDACIVNTLAGYPQARIIAPGPIDRTGWTAETAAIDAAMPSWCAAHVAAGRNVTYCDLRSVVSLSVVGDYHGDGAHLLELGYARLVAPLLSAVQTLVHTPLIPTNVTPPVVMGTPGVGNLLSSDNGDWTSAPSSYPRQWQRNAVDINGATSPTYMQIGADDGATITCLVSATNIFGTSNPSVSNSIVVPVSSVPVATVAPVVTGGKLVGDTLSCTTGTWTHSPTSYTYRWLRDGVAIGAATSSTYVRVAADIGPVIKGAVVGHNALDDGIEEQSNAADIWALSDLTHAPEFQLDHPTGAVGGTGAPSANLGTAAGGTLTTVATVVALLNGIKCRQFAAASNDLIYESGALTLADLVTTTQGHCIEVVKITAITNDSATLYANECIAGSQGAGVQVALRSSTQQLTVTYYDTDLRQVSDIMPLNTLVLVEWWWNGTTGYLRVANNAPISIPCGTFSLGLSSTLRIGRAFAGGGGGTITGIIGEVFLSKVIPADAERDTFRAYLAYLYGCAS